MKKKLILVVAIVLAMGITACSSNPKEEKSETETITGQKTSSEESIETAPANTQPEEKDEEETLDGGEIRQGDPIIGIVDKYENGVIVIRDMDDEDIVLYFSTRDAQVIEGDTPIAAGDIVEITYTGVQGSAEHPGTAIKVVAESMIYNQ